ncbi:hypothetical protein OIDMADRAFT_145025 [Oidiodendron maius Zn]|uniref:Transcription factor n=1 Tax=Oidiodendron maius (strain Zn) TaxID=913774 RepID=A0A0C3GXS4_OIDMZ|nr:hypothetical protein OIDMADRAFT_145025 [Oidiodendron maius Zn]
MDKSGDMGGPAANNSSDFVRKLYKQNNEDNSPSPYGPNAWEFKHPEFQANKKDSLDNIRRKAPAPRKPTQALEEGYPSQQMDLVNSQLMATQQQLQQLSERYQDLAQGHVVLLQQVVQLQKFVKNHDGVMNRVVGYLHNVDTQRRNNRIGGSFSGTAPGMNVGDPMAADPSDDHPASPLQQASQLLSELSAENLPNKELEQMTQDYHLRPEYSTPPNDQNGSGMAQAETPSAHIGYQAGNDLDNMVYPVGHTNGIDPINSEHIHNIPYALPANGMLQVDTMPEIIPESSSSSGEKKGNTDSGWGLTKPRILLVEDDKVCARIGSKFLQAFECGVETARDGLEAVSKINNPANHFDLILMDIIMPHLDGVSATVCIRGIRPNIPIIAMTSNIRADDIDMYFRYGMNDVLPKPFTKEGMLRSLEKHLSQFKRNAQFPASAQLSHPSGFVTANQPNTPLALNMGPLPGAQTIKDETSPGKSPVTATWNSPNQIPGPSPIVGNAPANFMQQSMRENGAYPVPRPLPHHPQAQAVFAGQNAVPMAAQRGQPRRVLSEMVGSTGPDDHPEKRQRMYPPPQTNFAQ